jgi:hypothetical protein
MQWAEQSRVPFGLANLSGRYGYNSAWLLLATIVRDPFDAHFLEHAILLPGTMLVFALLAVRRCWSLARNGVAGRLGLLGGLAIASPAVYTTVNSTAQDLVPLIAWVVCAALFVRSAERADESESRVTELWQVATIAIVAKLSAMLLILVPVAAMLRLPSFRAVPGRERVRLFARFVWLPALVLACWSARGLVLSGCAAYPAGATCVNALPWSVGSAAANAESRTITAWARQPFVEPARVPSFPGWVRPWFVRVFRDPDLLMPLALVIAGLIAAGTAGTAGTAGAAGTAGTAGTAGAATGPPLDRRLLVAVIGLAIAVWLATAPDPRFGAGPLWALGTLVAASAGMGSRDIARGSRARLALGLALLVWTPHAVEMLRLVTRPARNPGLTTVLRTRHIGIMRTPPMRAALTQAGDTIWVPTSTKDDQCFLAPLPCAPSLPAGLVVVRGRDGAITEFRTRNPDP